MSELKRISGIDIDQDIKYQWREWHIHRIGWAVFALILLAALAGLFGQGPLSHASTGEPGSALVLGYQRFDRYKAPTSLDVTVGAGVAQEGNVRLALNHDFLDRVAIQRIIPEPESVETGPDAITYVFAVAASGQPARISLYYVYVNCVV
jgi:hypothetical protein